MGAKKGRYRVCHINANAACLLRVCVCSEAIFHLIPSSYFIMGPRRDSWPVTQQGNNTKANIKYNI